MTDFINPYTFLPISDDKPARENLVRGKLTGKITCTLTIEKPTFIPNTSGQFTFTSDGKTCKAEEFFSYDDLSNQTGSLPDQAPTEPRIPGSEIRGMIRNVYEQLTNSCLSVIDRKNLTHMRTTLPKKPALWDMKENKLYSCEKAMLYTHKGREVDKTEDDTEVRFYSKDELKVGEFFSTSKVYIQTQKKKNKDGKTGSVNVVTDMKKEKKDGYEEGYLLIGEKFSSRKKYDGVFYKQGQELCSLNDGDIERFEFLLNTYLKNAKPEKESMGHSDYVNSYYATKKRVMKGEEGSLLPVYYNTFETNNETNVQSKYYLSPACITREVFHHTISDILRDGHKVHQPCDGENDEWCPACRLFGKIGQDGQGKALASRLRFCDSEVIQNPTFENPTVLPILGTPHYSATEFYLREPDGENVRIWNYDYYISGRANDGVKDSDRKEWIPKLAGRKVYWHGQDRPDEEKEKLNMTSKVRCLEGGSCQFDIYYEDLTKDELEWLIVCLELEENARHRIGRGKPFGMGVVNITVDDVKALKYYLDNGEIKRETSSKSISVSDEKKKVLASISTYMKPLTDEEKGIVTYPKIDDNSEGFSWFSKNKTQMNKPYIKEVLAPYHQKGTIKRKE